MSSIFFILVFMSLGLAYIMCQYPYFVCPIEYSQELERMAMSCEPSALFRPQVGPMQCLRFSALIRAKSIKRPSWYLLDSLLQETWVDAKKILDHLCWWRIFPKASINGYKIFRGTFQFSTQQNQYKVLMQTCIPRVWSFNI